MYNIVTLFSIKELEEQVARLMADEKQYVQLDDDLASDFHEIISTGL